MHTIGRIAVKLIPNHQGKLSIRALGFTHTQVGYILLTDMNSLNNGKHNNTTRTGWLSKPTTHS